MSVEQRAVAVQGLFGLLGLTAAAVGGIVAYSSCDSWAPALFVALIAMYLVSRFLAGFALGPPGWLIPKVAARDIWTTEER